jgi:hypothetical protein
VPEIGFRVDADRETGAGEIFTTRVIYMRRASPACDHGKRVAAFLCFAAAVEEV